MGRVPSPRRVALVARIELRRSWRRFARESPYRGLKLGAAVLFLGTYTVAAGGGGYALATVAREHGDAAASLPPLQLARAAVVGLFAMVAFFSVQRTVKGKGVPDAAGGVLAATSHRDVAVGLLAAEAGRVAAVVGGPLLALAAGVALGLGAPAAFPLLVAALLGVVLVGVTTGFVAGLAVKNLAARSRVVARHRLAANFLASAALLGGYLVVLDDPGSAAALARGVGANPLGWPADLALWVGPLGGDPVRAAGGALGLVAVPAAGAALATTLARWLWFADAVDTTDPDDGVGRRPSTRVVAAVGAPVRPAVRRLPRTTRAVAARSLRRVARAPYTAQYAVLPLFFLFYEAQAAVVTGTVPPRLPAVLGVAGAWATGAAFTLNPLGDEEPVLPVTLSTAVDGCAFVAGLAVAGIAVVAPVATLVVAGATVVGSSAPSAGALVVAATVMLCVAAPGLAAAAGVRFPKRTPTSIGPDRELVFPSPWAFAGYSLALAAVAAPLLVAHTAFAAEVAARAGRDPLTVRIAGVATTGVLAVGLGAAGYRDAARRITEYRLE